MAFKKMIIILVTIFLIGFLTGCGTGAKTTDGVKEKEKQVKSDQNEIAAKFHPSIETKEENNVVTISYKVKNISGVAQKLTFPSGLEADYIVYDQQGNKIKQYSSEVMTTQIIKEIILENNKELKQEFPLTDLVNGSYKVEVFLTAKEEQAKLVTDLLVEKSTYTKGSGVLLGQMDPHTIEVEINGEPSAFQLSKEAVGQIDSFKEGETVTFFYTENEIQKTIEKFIIQQ